MRMFAYLPDHHKGFTLVETLTSLLIFLMILSFSAPLLRLLDTPSYNQELSANQFFSMYRWKLVSLIQSQQCPLRFN